jgi:hypothetical protein
MRRSCRGLMASKPITNAGCLPNPSDSSPTQTGAAGGGSEKGGGSCQGPMASQAATRTLPRPLPLSARPFDIHRVLRNLRMCTPTVPELHHPPCPLPPHRIRSWWLRIRSRRYGLRHRPRGERRGELPRPPGLPSYHPCATSTIPDHVRRR